MKKVLKWIGIVLGSLLVLVGLTAVILSFIGGARMNKTHDITAEILTIPTDEATLARGEHLVNVACKDCHGSGLSGQPLLDDAPIGTVYAANITGLAETHNDADAVRAIRHAVDTDGRQLFIMPAESFIHFSQEDLGAVVAYLKTIPRAGAETPAPELTFLGRTLLGAGLFGNVFPAEYIDHDMAFAPMPEIGANIAYGEYLAAFCTSCHGANLAGSQPADPESPPAPNLTPNGRLANWTEEGFLTMMRTGITPEGRELQADFMPYESFGNFTDEELRGLWLYLQSLPPASATD
jgi:mono/diheme cytochrome c family protein